MINTPKEEDQINIRSETSLRAYIANEPCELKRANYSLELAWLIRENKQVESKKLAQLSVKGVKSSGEAHALLLAKANVVLSFLNFRLSDYERSIRLASDAILMLDQEALLRWQVRAIGNIGICQKETGNRLEAIENLQLAVDLAHKGGANCKVELAYAMHDLALCQRDLPLMRQALVIASEINDRVTMALASANLGSWLVEDGNLADAQELLVVAEEITAADQFWTVLSFVLTTQGEYHCAAGEKEKAIEKFTEGLALSRIRKNPQIIALSLSSYAICLQKHGHHSEAMLLLKEAIACSIEANHKPLLVKFYRMQSDSYEQMGEFGKALASSRKAIEQQDELHEEQKEKQRTVLQAAHEAEKMRLEARLERKRNQELEGLVTERTDALSRSLSRESELTRDLERALIAEAEVSALKSQIINNISHEFRTPLTIINSTSDILHNYRDRLSEEKQEAHYQRVKDAINYLTESLSNVIAVGDTTSATIRPKTTSTSFPLLVEHIVNHAECHSIIDNKLTVRHDATCSAILNVDVALVARVLGQLVSNSLKFCDDKSTIVISFGVDGDYLTFSVADEGIGVPLGETDKVFDLFYRGSNIETRRGIGLGLYNLYKSVRTMNGSAKLTSAGLNQGCLVEIRIPDVSSIAAVTMPTEALVAA